ncbi:MAG TPA: Bax inhibitor-1/YccA family protein [Stackebrandtia sp.]|jgi:uncharacterized YccA/Bax inhibitor family protein|uniref:Bax inhibitor-1/YccA family protein n=1 Tax=Stackebrandtia sp. TaxID=2023065 RepID=UPI002D72DBCE|nr:Bax inhibitor-1/YccA family protein [Stackebrandtia sp.]HZE37376.1 Bax inhibitor-1/YccA family protein [Stackebrandtia sp.]
MRSNNPALNRMLNSAVQERQGMAAEYGPYGQMTAPPQVQPMTLDSVVVRTVGMLLLTGIAGAVGWNLLTVNPQAAMVAAGIGGFVALGVIIASWFMRIMNPWIVGVYAVAQGVGLGVVSAAYESVWNGIVLQAVVATFGVFFAMAALYKFKVVRNGPKFQKFMIGAGIGILAMILINLVMSLMGVDMGLFNNSTTAEVTPLQWIIAIGMVAYGAFSFVIDFDMVEQGVRYGLPQKYAWWATFALVAGLIFLYWNILRLLGYVNR